MLEDMWLDFELSQKQEFYKPQSHIESIEKQIIFLKTMCLYVTMWSIKLFETPFLPFGILRFF